MTVLVDTNIFISYLLINDQDNTITKIVEAGFENKYILILPHEIINEFNQKLTEKNILQATYQTKTRKNLQSS